jgi:hypothetical protein
MTWQDILEEFATGDDRAMCEEILMLRTRLGPAGAEMLRDLKARAEKAEAAFPWIREKIKQIKIYSACEEEVIQECENLLADMEGL